LAEIVADLGGDLHGSPQVLIDRLGPLQGATAGTLCFIADRKYEAQIAFSTAAALIVPPTLLDIALGRGAVIVAADPYLYFSRLSRWWVARLSKPAVPGVHPSAVVEAGAQVHASASVGPFVHIEEGACIGPGVVVGAHSTIGRDSTVGAMTRLHARVTIAEACVIGQRVILHPGAVIGADGFGFAASEGRWEKIEQLGGVRIGDDVEIGANTCVDRGALQDTVIEEGVKLDNQIQIAHNVHIGAHSAMAGCVGVAGSTRIGAHCTFGGAAMILGHLVIADHVHISAASVVMSSIAKAGQYSGVFPLDDNATWEKNAATLRQLYALRGRLRALEKKIT
jgi:UDP-3-O-[3-hydroxymyristoyl] glucosamine N-acyltransferase